MYRSSDRGSGSFAAKREKNSATSLAVKRRAMTFPEIEKQAAT
jgi:hypothetical protein